jgi:multimeric flavodoxin WrbA
MSVILMTKKVLVISSSPRKGGNSDILCDEFIKGATSSENNIEKIYFQDKNINYCLGDMGCQQTNKCSQEDDMEEILNKMVSSDIIVMATPVYFYTMCGQMKTFIDRTVPRYRDMKNKEFYFIITAAVGTEKALQTTLYEFKAFLSCLINPHKKGVIYGTDATVVGDIKNNKKAMEKAYQYGKNIR